MSLTALRDRFSTRESSTAQAGDEAGDPHSGANDQLPFADYDRLDDREVIQGLCDHSQVELEAVESYERSHKDREPVLDKLRWMRGPEPLPGYDALGIEEVVTALEQADLTTIRKVRAYERKFANRRDVLEGVVRVHHRHLESEPESAAPESAAPAYGPTSYGQPAQRA